MQTIVPRPGEDLLELAKRCGAVYICPKDGNQRKGPLVVYAGKDAQGRNLVGDIYLNFRMIETHPLVVMAFAEAVHLELHNQGLLAAFDTVCGIPQGGRTFGQTLAQVAGKRFVYADKVPKPAVSGQKQEYEWDLSQFQLETGEPIAIAEDVFNNFANTDNTLAQVAAFGANPVLLVGALNRSPVYGHTYIVQQGLFAGCELPILAAVREAYPEYTQDDPAVAADIAVGNLELEVKKNWSRLCALM